jgi:alkyl hydroperoxide reductase subunit AhpF
MPIGETISRKGGFVLAQLIQSDLSKQLGGENNLFGCIAIDSFGRTNITGVLAAHDASEIVLPQVIIAASEGSSTSLILLCILP